MIPTSKIKPEPKTHEGHEWLCVLSGRMRLVLGDHDLVLGPGEVAEFDTQVPHWFGSTGDQPVEVLSLFGRQGEQMHVRAKSSEMSAGYRKQPRSEGGSHRRDDHELSAGQ